MADKINFEGIEKEKNVEDNGDFVLLHGCYLDGNGESENNNPEE